MPTEIITHETSDGETTYHLSNPDLKMNVDLKNIIFEDIITDCHFIDEEEAFVLVHYYDWENNEMLAIVSAEGELLRKGILEVSEFIADHKMFVIVQRGEDLGEDRNDYMLDEETHAFAVMDRFGDYIIPPQPDLIEFNDFEGVFETGSGDDYKQYDLTGKIVEE